MTDQTVTQNKIRAGLLSLQSLTVAFGLTALLATPTTAQTQMAEPDSTPALIAQQYPQQQKRRTLLDILFGNPAQPRQQEVTRPPVQQPQRRSAPVKKKPVVTKPKPAIITPPQPEAVAKNPDARKIMVIGDFIAGGLAEGLTETFSQTADLQVINRINGSSGFVRQDYYNWSKELPAILTEQKPAVVVMMIGANDRQPLTQKSVSVAADTDEWKKLYQSRVDEFLQVTAKSGVPVVWIGQPPYQSSSLSQTMLSLNKVYKTAAEQAVTTEDTTPQVVFADVWDGFVDDKGSFTQTGVDVNGQTVRLRGNDGINMTAAGKRKLAFYAEKPLRQLLKLSSPDAPVSSDSKSNEPMALPVQKEITRIGPMKLNDLDQSGDDTLLGDTTVISKTAAADNKPAMKTAPHGRADDFSWPRH